MDARKRILSAYQTIMDKDFVLLGGGIDIFDGTTSEYRNPRSTRRNEREGLDR